MSVRLLPSRLEPTLVPRIWGTRSLGPLFPEKTSLQEPIGEVWLTGQGCRFADGPFAGRALAEAWGTMTPDWAGSHLRTDTAFPLLVKFIFPEEKLSIQVHPNDDYAREHEQAAGGVGKTEMWYVVGARPGAEVLVGLKPRVTPVSFRQAIAQSTVEDCLEHVAVSPGDAIFVPAGTVHTIWPGVVLCEIQQQSDITYRIFDYNRRTSAGVLRPLHVDQALAVITFGEQSGGKLEPIRVTRRRMTETYFVACRYFAAEKWEFAEPLAAVTSFRHFDLLIFLEGCGRIESGQGAGDYDSPQVWFFPAGLGAYRLEPQGKTSLLRTYVPDIINDFGPAMSITTAERRAHIAT